MRKWLLSLVVLAALCATAAQALAASRSVKLGDDWFVSKGGSHTVTVRKGTRVTWRNTGQMAHNVVVRRGPAKFHSTVLAHGAKYSKKLRKAGTYKLYCGLHPWMKMTLRVTR